MWWVLRFSRDGPTDAQRFFFDVLDIRQSARVGPPVALPHSSPRGSERPARRTSPRSGVLDDRRRLRGGGGGCLSSLRATDSPPSPSARSPRHPGGGSSRVRATAARERGDARACDGGAGRGADVAETGVGEPEIHGGEILYQLMGQRDSWCDGERLSRSSRKRRGSARRRGGAAELEPARGIRTARGSHRRSGCRRRILVAGYAEAPARGGVAREGARHASARISALELTRHGRKLDFALAPRARFSGAGSPASSPAEMVNFKLARIPTR